MSTRNFLTAALAAAIFPGASRAETISGTVDFTGTPPAMAKLNRASDPFCAKTAMNDEAVMVKDKKLANVWVHVGSGDEMPGRTGFAHVVEHLMFMGSQNAP